MSARIAAGLRRVRSGRSSSGDREFGSEKTTSVGKTGPPEMVPRRSPNSRGGCAIFTPRTAESSTALLRNVSDKAIAGKTRAGPVRYRRGP